MTTTDPFTEAARAEAEAVMSEARERVGITVQEQNRYVEGHVAGAEWARAHLAAQGPTDAEVLAALNAQSRGLVGAHATQRDSLDRFESQSVAAMRAALSAARAARRDEEKRDG